MTEDDENSVECLAIDITAVSFRNVHSPNYSIAALYFTFDVRNALYFTSTATAAATFSNSVGVYRV